uniref:Uncharacterized protein n=1 Tax=Chenopodium quinoa TaxID=63459 RepID=A0A803L1P3_CHEQI
MLNLSPFTTTAANITVLDIDGYPLQANTTNYYILPVNRGPHYGGLVLTSKLVFQPCPLFIALDKGQIPDGFPYKFYSVNHKDSLIFLSTDLNLELEVLNFCMQTNIWQLYNDAGTRKVLVNIHGTLGNPGAETLDSWFKIEKAGKGEYDYKFVYCPSVVSLVSQFVVIWVFSFG